MRDAIINFTAWVIGPLACLGLWYIAIVGLGHIFGGPARFMAVGGCAFAAWAFFYSAGDESPLKKAIGYAAGTAFAVLAVLSTGWF